MFGTSTTTPTEPLNATVQSEAVAINLAPDSFGQTLHELVEKGKRGESLHVKFTENFVIVQHEEKFCCYPIGYVKTILPRYRICDVILSRAAVNKVKVYCGWLLAIVGVILMIMSSKEDKDDSNKDTYMYVGVVGLLLGAILIVAPFLCKKYVTAFKLLPDKDKDPMKGCLKMFASDDTYFTIETNQRPNEQFLLEYVYGPLVKLRGMDQHHVASHLISSNIMSEMKGSIEFPSMKVA